MPDISGPIGINLYKKGNLKYLLVAASHLPYDKEPNSLALTEYLDSLFQNKDQWDFYIEQSILVHPSKTLTPKIKFLDRFKSNKLRVKTTNDVIQDVLAYYQKQGCFSFQKDICNRKFNNVRFHFIDIRQDFFGKSCRMHFLLNYKQKQTSLFVQLAEIFYSKEWKDNSKLKNELSYNFDIFLMHVSDTLNCFNEPKIIKQIAKSNETKKINFIFSNTINIIKTTLLNILSYMKPNRNIIIDDFILFLTDYQGKTKPTTFEIINYMGYKIFGNTLWTRMVGKIQNDYILRISNFELVFNNRVILFPTQLVFYGRKLLMDLYSISRITKPYNKNVVVIAGYNHINTYSYFLNKIGFKVEWVGKNIGKNIISVPSEFIKKKKKRFGLFGGKTIKKRKQLKGKKTMKKRNF